MAELHLPIITGNALWDSIITLIMTSIVGTMITFATKTFFIDIPEKKREKDIQIHRNDIKGIYENWRKN